MQAEVKKPFNTYLRRLRVGDPVLSSDDLAPHTYASLLAGEFIEQPAADTVATEPPKPRGGK